MSLSRIHRLLRLIMLLQSQRARSVQDLTAELGVSRRTLFRDLAMLQAAGIPCYYESGVGYRIARHFFLPPINLTIPETLGLLLLGKTAAAQPARPFMTAALSAISKLVTTVPEPIRQACNDLLAGVSVDPGAQCVSPQETRFYPLLQRAIDERRTCSLRYRSPVEGEFTCRLDPYLLHFAGRAWYVLGWTDRHREVRILKLARILELELLDRRFVRPRRFSAQDKLGLAWQLNPEGRTYQVELEFSPKVATNVSEVRWHPTQEHEILPDGRCLMRFRVDGLNEIAWWICGYADQVIVRKPAALRQLVCQMHQQAAARYLQPDYKEPSESLPPPD